MDEPTKPRVLEGNKPHYELPSIPKEIVIIAVVMALIAGAILAGLAIVHHTRSNHTTSRNAADARVVAEKVVADITKRDGAAARKLGDAKFQSMYTDKQLSDQFIAIKPVTDFDHSLFSQKLLGNNTALIIYKYPTKDLAYYIRFTIIKDSKTGQWQLTDITGNANLSTL